MNGNVKENFNEVGVTNLGLVPKGMSFFEAVLKTKDKRKYVLNPYEGGHRLTICDVLRAMWKTLDTMPESPQREQLYEFLGFCGDAAKRMDVRMKELKSIILSIDPEYKEEKSDR